ncbi:alcohol dehydrogenase catalytic domain-containing protein [Streptomyces sp. NPDC051315]|uniref:alcohol dehydrogenase catalytic domain-containing protein n=1 Tax=Streptomyces sp. NPDC051315 TaxID=3365650 RepID=UPI0037B376D2
MTVSPPRCFPLSRRTRDGKVGRLNDRVSDNEVLRVKAVGITEFGGPEVLQVLELPVPDARPGEVRIRVRAATVNAVDALQRSGPARSPEARLPFVPGMEAAGVVDRIGAGTDTDLSVGDHVNWSDPANSRPTRPARGLPACGTSSPNAAGRR